MTEGTDLAGRRDVAPRAPLLRGGAEASPPDGASPRSVTEAREAIAATRERMARTADLLKSRVELAKGRLERRLDLGAKIRQAVAGREAVAIAGAFAAGLVWALIGRKKRLDRDDMEALHDWTEHRAQIKAALDLEDFED
ncbi:MAG TPA: hypothetical protein VK837_02995 [Longimicrobiales bacterium]|nr:hypothetical protein [Longimicrobiales bacterium]